MRAKVSTVIYFLYEIKKQLPLNKGQKIKKLILKSINFKVNKKKTNNFSHNHIILSHKNGNKQLKNKKFKVNK